MALSAVFCIVIGVILITLLIGIFPFPISFVDFPMDENRPLEKSKISLASREKILKNIWIAQEKTSPFHIRMKSHRSQLFISWVQNKFEITEKLFQVRCLLQDKFFMHHHQPMQQLKCFQTPEGIYSYASGQFIAESTEMTFFRIPGLELPQQTPIETPFLKGIAEDVYLSMKGTKPVLQADSFQATVIVNP